MPPQLANIVAEAQRSFAARIYYPALSVALTLPDICVSLTHPARRTQTQRDQYVDWVNQYAAPHRLGVDGLSCYQLRCGVVHSGNAARNEYLGADAVIFTVPETGSQVHAIRLVIGESEAMSLMLEQFLNSMCEGVSRWYQDHANNEVVARNLTHLLTWHPEGIAPFIVGAPLIGSVVR